MTAIVGILNKRAVAVAADSAVTVTSVDGEEKIYNTAQKVFSLSKKNPVAVMIYNNASFMGTPWELIIKLYHDTSEDKDLDLLNDYALDFLDFLHKYHFFCTDQDKHAALYKTMQEYVKKVLANAEDEEGDGNLPSYENAPAEVKQMYLKKWIDNITELCNEEEVCDDFQDFTYAEFKKYAKEEIKEIKQQMKEENIPCKGDMWERGFYNFLIKKFFWDHTGIVFAGYGRLQIYPSITTVGACLAVDGRLKYVKSECTDITNQNCSGIHSFGQDDVILTLLRGLAPNVRDKYDEEIQKAITEQCNDTSIEPKKISTDVFKNVDDFITTEYLNGLHRSIDSFNVQDMANMAESLISVTNLQRHITSSEESVGGPIDVAIITRSEGFVWMKHKEWIDRSLNPQLKNN